MLTDWTLLAPLELEGHSLMEVYYNPFRTNLYTRSGSKGRPMHNPEIKPQIALSKETYMNRTNEENPTIKYIFRCHDTDLSSHFYEKLLKLKDMMKTETGKQMALKRHQFMEAFLEEFLQEWDGKR
jgi:uncharacterized protein